MKIQISSLLLLLAFLFSCSASQKYYRQAQQFESQDNIERAASHYLYSLRENINNKNALYGAERTGSIVFKKKIESLEDLYNRSEYSSVITQYNEIIRYQTMFERVGVQLQLPHSATTNYVNSKEILAEDHYNRGLSAYNREDYSTAIRAFESAHSVIPNFKDTRDLIVRANQAKNNKLAEDHYNRGLSAYNREDYSTAIRAFESAHSVIPNFKDTRNLIEKASLAKKNQQAKNYYNQAIIKLNNKNYRGAYLDFRRCSNLIPGFKNVSQKMTETMEKARVNVGVFEFSNDTRLHGAHGTLYSYTLTNLLNNKSQFLKIIDQDHLQRSSMDSRMFRSGFIDQGAALNLGKTIGLDYVVLGRLTSAYTVGGQLNEERLEAFELTINRAGQYDSRLVSFPYYKGSIELVIEVQYQIIDVETSQIIKSDIIRYSANDKVAFARHRNPSALYVVDPLKAVRAFEGQEGRTAQVLGALISAAIQQATRVDQSIFSARQTLKNEGQLQIGVLRRAAQDISRGIIRDVDR